jgi:hypothetical protein
MIFAKERRSRVSTEIGQEENTTVGYNYDREGMNELVPTKSCLGRARHGRGRITRRGQRPSFTDIGIFRANFSCWADTKLPH